MRGRRIKIETVLEDGSRVSIVIHGRADLSKIERFLAMIEAMESGTPPSPEAAALSSVYDRVKYLVEERFADRPFSLSDIHRAYVETFADTVKKSTLATYLTRLVDEGVLIREGYRGRYVYRYVPKVAVAGKRGQQDVR